MSKWYIDFKKDVRRRVSAEVMWAFGEKDIADRIILEMKEEDETEKSIAKYLCEEIEVCDERCEQIRLLSKVDPNTITSGGDTDMDTNRISELEHKVNLIQQKLEKLLKRLDLQIAEE